MKRFCFLLLVYGLVTFHASAQTHFITAGQTQGMIFTDYVPNIDIPKYNYASAFDSGSVTIDINHDSINDFRVYRNSLNDGAVNLILKIFPLNGSSVLVTVDTCAYTDGNIYPQPFALTKKFSSGDTMNTLLNTHWLNTGSGWIHRSSFSNNNGTITCTDLDTLSLSDPYYYLLKVIVDTDTLLGYLHFQINGREILDFACEGPTSSYIITSTNNLSATNISISPNPFSNQINIGTDKAVEYQVTDYTGRVLLSGKTERSISTEMLPSGSYLLLLKNEDLYSAKKMVKY